MGGSLLKTREKVVFYKDNTVHLTPTHSLSYTSLPFSLSLKGLIKEHSRRGGAWRGQQVPVQREGRRRANKVIGTANETEPRSAAPRHAAHRQRGHWDKDGGGDKGPPSQQHCLQRAPVMGAI